MAKSPIDTKALIVHMLSSKNDVEDSPAWLKKIIETLDRLTLEYNAGAGRIISDHTDDLILLDMKLYNASHSCASVEKFTSSTASMLGLRKS